MGNRRPRRGGEPRQAEIEAFIAKSGIRRTVASARANANSRVHTGGDAMVGPLYLPADPTADLQASTKGYADAKESNAKGYADAAKVSNGGDAMTGPLYLPAATPTVSNQATNKGYVDAVGNAKVATGGDTMTGPLYLHASPSVSNQASNKGYVDAVGDTKLAKAGGAMTGILYALDGVTTKTKASAPVDTDFGGGAASGLLVVDTGNSRLWARVGTAWRSVVLG